VSLEIDTGSTASFTDDAGAIFDMIRDSFVSVTGSNSSIALTPANAGTAFEVDTRPLFVQTDGSLVEVAPQLWETSGDYRKSWIARASNGSGSVSYRVGDLQQGVSYDVARGQTAIGSFVASDGSISFSDVPGTTTTQTYALTKSAVQPASGSTGGGGGGSPAPAVLALLALAALRRRIG
jgi:hypothetical protein